MENNWAEIFMTLVEFFCVDESNKGPILSDNLAIFSRKALQINNFENKTFQSMEVFLTLEDP